MKSFQKIKPIVHQLEKYDQDPNIKMNGMNKALDKSHQKTIKFDPFRSAEAKPKPTKLKLHLAIVYLWI